MQFKVKKYPVLILNILLLASLFLLAGCGSETKIPQREQTSRHIVENGILYSHASGYIVDHYDIIIPIVEKWRP